MPSGACCSISRRHDSHLELETEIKKADVVEHPEVFHHVGLLIIEPPAGLDEPGALYLVIRRLRFVADSSGRIAARSATLTSNHRIKRDAESKELIAFLL